LYFNIREQQDNAYSAYKILTHLQKICAEEQERVFCYPATDSQKEKYRVNDRKDHESIPKKPYGKNPISNTMKTIAHICGFDNSNNFTNHAARALGITIMCESNLDDEYKCRQRKKYAAVQT
jgi:AraC-like DNA-binding protein